jgi:hypothetical protein
LNVTQNFENVATVTGETETGVQVTDSDPSTVVIAEPGIDIEKATNGIDADVAPGPGIPFGGSVQWTYVVTNTGDVTLSNITVTDDILGAISCPTTTLGVGESMTCTASGTAAAGQYANIGTVTGRPPVGQDVTDSDPSHYFGEFNPGIHIEKKTNGINADDPNAGDAPQLNPGDPVTWTYEVTNTGNVPLSNVNVTDDQGVAVSCPQTTLAVGESMTCTANGVAEDLMNTWTNREQAAV